MKPNVGSAELTSKGGPMWQAYHFVMRHLETLDRHEWFYVLIGVVIIGLVCMRGFGSRSNY